ncbi:MAG: hypothetical protein ACI8PZ_000164 [Myxococcota bacterium]|jgi:hypothetical protein
MPRWMVVWWLALGVGCTEYGLSGEPKPDDVVVDTAVPVGVLALEVSPEVLDFGAVPVGGRAEGSATVRNVGDTVVAIAAIVLIDPDSAFELAAPPVDALAPGESVDLALAFAPLARGAFAGSAWVDSNAADPADDRVQLLGHTPDPGIWIDPTFTDLGAVTLGDREVVYLTVGNDGPGAVTVHETGWASTSAELAVTDAGPLDALPLVLGAGDVAVVEVTYAPVDLPGDEATFTVFSDDPESPEISAQLGGEGDGEAGLWLRPPVHDFGVLEVGLADGVYLELGNDGTLPVTVHGTDWSTSSPELALTDLGALASLPLVLDPGGRARVQVTYTPVDEAPDSATFGVRSDDPASPELHSELRGNGCIEWSGIPTLTDWQQHDGLGLQWFPYVMPSHGAVEEYLYSSIPSEGDPGWVGAPDPDIVNYDLYSTLCAAGAGCRAAGEFTYFQTFVDIPVGLDVDRFEIHFAGIDDGVRVTVFNSTYPGGYVEPGSYVFLGGVGTSNLADHVVPGERNRVVVTHVDDCCSGSRLAEARVVLEGEVIIPCE